MDRCKNDSYSLKTSILVQFGPRVIKETQTYEWPEYSCLFGIIQGGKIKPS